MKSQHALHGGDHLHEIERRAAGCLLATACGDALAMAAYLSPEENRRRHGWLDEFRPGPPDHPVHAGLPAGRVTDDTQQAMALATAILRDGDVTIEGTARAICDWYLAAGGDECPWVGPSTKKAVRRLLAGDDPRETGLWGETNGSAMRVAPVGILYAGDPAGAVEAAARSCVPTHNTSTAISATAAVAAAIAAAFLPGATVDSLVATAQEAAEAARRYGNQVITPSVARRIQAAVTIARSPLSLERKLQDLFDLIGAGLAATEAVPAAFGCLVLGQGHPVETILIAANLGGDADTVAAIAGGMAGALSGLDGIPDGWRRAVETANPEYDFVGTARALAALRGRRVA